MKRNFYRGVFCLLLSSAFLGCGVNVSAQYRTEKNEPNEVKSEKIDCQQVQVKDTAALTVPLKISLEKALEIAMSENTAVKVADKEIERVKYAERGAYASLFPKADVAGVFQRTIKKRVMYMDIDMSKFPSMGGHGGSKPGQDGSKPGHDDAQSGQGGSQVGQEGSQPAKKPSMDKGIEIGRWNTYNLGLNVAMPLVNAQLWNSIKISASDVELAVEKARSSKLEMVTQVKKSFYAVLFAQEALQVYKDEYINAEHNFDQTSKRYRAQKASELEYRRAESALAATVPNIYNAESNLALALWRLKAVMGVDLDLEIQAAGTLEDYSKHMLYEINDEEAYTLKDNSSMRQLAIQAEQLARVVKMNQSAYLPSLAVNFSYSVNAMTNNFKFSEYKWTPYSYIGLSLNIPIFAGGKRHNDVRQAKVRCQQLELQTIDAERNLKIGIRQSLNKMETNMKNYAAAKKAEETAAKAYHIVQKSYFVGRSTNTEMNDAQLVLTKARLGVSKAVFDYVSAKADLEQIIGRDLR